VEICKCEKKTNYLFPNKELFKKIECFSLIHIFTSSHLHISHTWYMPKMEHKQDKIMPVQIYASTTAMHRYMLAYIGNGHTFWQHFHTNS